jgi:mxaJ protein
MSSGSRHTVVSLACAAAALGFTTYAAMPARGPVHLAVAPVESTPWPAPAPDTLRVCADPNNLPFSNDRGEGFENRIAEIVAHDLDRRVSYYWQPQRRGFMRTTLRAGACDVVMGIPATSETARVTRPYYRSSYVFVTRGDGRRPVTSFDDPRLRRLRIGIQITGTDYENPPAAQALASRHITGNVEGYTVYGDYSTPNPTRGIVDAVAAGEVDVAIVWGPQAGYFAAREPAPLELHAVTPAVDASGMPFAFDIAMGVRRDDGDLAAALDRAIERHAKEIRDVLAGYGVPVERTGGAMDGHPAREG